MNSKCFLMGSLVANVILAAAVAYVFKQLPDAPELAGFTVITNSAAPHRVQAAPTVVEGGTVTNAATFDWRRVESSDYRQYIANLRAVGCPEETIRDIIVADVKKLFTARAKAERGTTNQFQYWKGGNPLGNLLSEETIAKQHALGKEKRDLLQDLLGSEAPKEVESGMTAANLYESMLDFLPSDKQTQIKELEERFAGKLMGTMKKATQGDTTAMRTVQTEKETELVKLLTPEEKVEYDLRMSQTAMVMRMQMGDLELSEPEFREVFKLRKQVDDQFGIEGMGITSKADQEKRDAAKKEMNAQLATVLGDRYPEYKYEMSGEWAAQMLHRVARENNLSRETALKAYAMTDVARAQADSIKADASQPEEKKQVLLQSVHDETVQSVTQVLGQTAAETYFKKIALIPGFKTASR